jgi:hypothetical protein
MIVKKTTPSNPRNRGFAIGLTRWIEAPGCSKTIGRLARHMTSVDARNSPAEYRKTLDNPAVFAIQPPSIGPTIAPTWNAAARNVTARCTVQLPRKLVT